ncbi:MAG: glycosyltransferase family 2 protein [Rhodospirillales bacterium]
MATKRRPDSGISFVIPVFNEENAIADTVRRVIDQMKKLDRAYEVIVVDDGSSDGTFGAASTIKGITVLRHPSNSGYGRTLKTGIANANFELIGIVDADGTYEIEKIPELVAAIDDGFDMAVASRSNIAKRDSMMKRLSRWLYIMSIRILVGRDAQDPNSGLRVFSRSFVMTFFPFLCNSFSFTTSLTVFAFGGSYFVKYVPSQYEVREGKSKVRHIRDTLRTIQLIVQGVTFFNPVKLYLLLAAAHVAFVALPSLLLWSCVSVAAGTTYLTAGSLTILLLGLGALGDIVRISMIRSSGNVDFEHDPGALKNPASASAGDTTKGVG